MATKEEIMKFLRDNSNETLMIDPCDENGKMLKPAVTFNPSTVVSYNGTKVTNGDIYVNFMRINNDCIVRSVDALRYKTDPYFVASTVSTLSNNNFDIIIDSFTNSLKGHIAVAVRDFNFIIKSLLENNPEAVKPLDVVYINETFLGRYDNPMYSSGIRNFFNATSEERELICKTGVIDNWVIGCVNNTGERIYSMMFSKLAEVLSLCNMDENTLNDIVSIVNGITASMMSNLTYECSAFIYNIENFNGSVLSTDDISAIRHINNPKLNPFSEENRQRQSRYNDYSEDL